MSVGADVAGCLGLVGGSLPGSGGIYSSRDLDAFRDLPIAAQCVGWFRDFRLDPIVSDNSSLGGRLVL